MDDRASGESVAVSNGGEVAEDVLAAALGAEAPIWKWERYYDVNVDEQLFEEYRQFTRLKHKNLAPYSEYVKTRGLRWPVVKQEDGS